MDRRQFLKSTTGAAAATVAASAGTLAAPAVHAPVRDLTMATAWPDGVAGLADQAFRLARRIETATGGRYRITVLPGAANDASGSFDLVHASAHRHLSHHPAFAYFAGLPIAAGLSPAELPLWLASGGQDLWDDLSCDLGERSLLVGHTGGSSWLWSGAPIFDADDLAGRRIAAVGLGRDIVGALGGVAIDATPADLAHTLHSGTADAVEWCGLMCSAALGLDRARAHVVRSVLNPNGMAVALCARRRAWDALPDGDRTLLEAIAAAEYRESLAEAQAIDSMIHTAIAPDATPPDLKSTIVKLADAIVADVAGRDATSMRIDASYMAFARSLRRGVMADASA
ncbi:MAG: hypothetical protein AB1749_10550 [Pseudomonadota bacterium]